MSVYKCSFRIYIIFYHRRPFNKTTATLVRPHPFSTLCTTPLGKMTLCLVHKKSVHGGVKYKCKYCDSEYTQNANLHTHIKAKHLNRRFPCEVCGHQFTDKGRLKQHKLSIHEGVRYPCEFCDYKAPYPTSLSSHIKKKHDK